MSEQMGCAIDGGDVFVHISAIERAGLHGLEEGQPISQEIEQDSRSGKPRRQTGGSTDAPSRLAAAS
jgi:cold shock CspA family protein